MVDTKNIQQLLSLIDGNMDALADLESSKARIHEDIESLRQQVFDVFAQEYGVSSDTQYRPSDEVKSHMTIPEKYDPFVITDIYQINGDVFVRVESLDGMATVAEIPIRLIEGCEKVVK